MKEIWKDIPNYEGLYQISNLARVKSFHQNKPNGIILSYNVRQGYNTVQLHNKGDRHSYQIHRLVAEAFIPNPNNYPFINHIDENRKNNNIDNLEWCTQKMNVQHSAYKMRHPKSVCYSKTGEKYIYYRKENNKLYYRVCIPQINIDKRFKTMKEALLFKENCYK